jgi:hypothetical protein
MTSANAAVLGAVVIWAAIPWTPGQAPPEAPTKTTEVQPSGPPPPGYLERQKACPQNQDCKEDSLLLPLAKCAGVLAPQKAAAGGPPLPDWGDLRPEVLWQIVPWQSAHEEFITRYAQARTDDEKFQLADWCAAQRLAPCDEFILRDLLRLYWFSVEHPTYKKALERWMPMGRQRPSPFVLDLPVRGEWYVESDEGGLLRRKHSAVFAHNLVIVRSGRQFKESASTLSNYFAWGQPFYAVSDGLILKVDDRHPDPPAGRAPGLEDVNYLIQDCGGGVHIYYGHIQNKSAAVREGQAVERGQALGKVGNSGGNGYPHLQFMIMDADHFAIPGRFRLEVQERGRWALKDGVDLADNLFIRPVTAPAPTPAKPTRTGTGPARPPVETRRR